MRFRAAEVAEGVGGRLDGPDVPVDGVTLDSRAVPPGSLFVPIVAARDGHDFIPAALDAGAAAYLTARAPAGGSAIVVHDTTVALSRLGRAARARLGAGVAVVGVTGSVGKTSVKDLAAAAIGSARRTHANLRSFNNELGLPLTLINAPDDVEVAIVEMGARGLGHVAELCRIARPTIAVVTAVALVHSELFGRIEAVAHAKGELVESLPANGTAVLNADDPLVRAMAERTEAAVSTYGVDPSADVVVEQLALDEQLRPRFTLRTPAGSVELRLATAGAHMASNAAAAVAVGLAAGVPLDDLADGVSGARLSPWRMEVHRAPTGGVVINDAYNANPTSMRAALRALLAVPAERRIAVLGPMAELGDEGPAEHRSIALEATTAGIEVVAVGCPSYDRASHHAPDLDAAFELIGRPTAGTAVLVKGSRVASLERLAERLVAVAT